MKRFLLILFLVLSLLVSCATTKENPAPQVESPAQQTQVAAPETPVQEEEKISEDSDILVPQEEDAPESEPESEEQPVADQEVAAEETPVAEAAEESVSAIDEQDWSQVISAAPSAPTEEQKPQEEPVQEVPVQAKTETPAAEPVQAKTETPAAEPAKAQTPPAAAAVRPSSFVDKLTALIKKVGNFVADQILLSIGIFVCIGGMIYLIAALVISGRRDRENAKAGSRKTRARDEESEAFNSSSDTDPETDEDFLKRLLGDGNE